MEEAAMAERVIIMDKGKVMLDGSPVRFPKVRRSEHDLDVPFVVDLADRLVRRAFLFLQK